MERKIVEFRSERGDSILVEVLRPAGEGPVRAGRGQTIVEKASDTFETAVGRINGAVKAVVRSLQALDIAHESAEIEFTVRMSAEAGVIIAAGGMDANFTVRIAWKQDGVRSPTPPEKIGLGES